MEGGVKAALKEAREAIKNKDYKTALKLSKGILREDKTNYMGLLFLGVSLQEVGPVDQAPKAFHKAIQLNGENILAWNGLLSYYEKHGSTDQKEVFDVYAKVLELDSGGTSGKLIEIINKMVLLEIDEYSLIIESLQKATANEKFKEDVKEEAYKAIIEILSNKKALDDSLLEIYETSYNELLKKQSNVSVDRYSNYLRLLYKLRNHDAVVSEAHKMHTIYENDTISLEWICKVFNERSVEGKPTENLFGDIHTYCYRLLELYDKSAIGFLTKSILHFNEGAFLKARDSALQAAKLKPGLLHAWVFLTKCFLTLRSYAGGIESANKAENCLNLAESVNPGLREIVNECRCKCLCKSEDKKNLDDGINLCLNLLKENEDNPTIIAALIEGYINTRNFVQAEMWMPKLSSSEQRNLLKAQLSISRKDVNGALKMLEQNPVDSFDYWLLLGKTYWNSEMFEKSLVPFLKATKLDQNSYECFLYLGNYYQKFRELDKSRRCYEKSFEINNNCSEAGIELSKIYRKQKMWDENLNLLLNLTAGKTDPKVLWAYLELGVHYLEKEDYAEAINSLRFVIRVDPNNSNCWETLADAYLARGAYTSALKSYQKVVELTSNSLYSLHQIANIKKILGEYAEAKTEFENVLKLDKAYTPALKGMAETCWNLARQYHRQQLHGLARNEAECAVDNITIALRGRSDLTCLWKIIADCCGLVAGLPQRFSCLRVAVALAEGKEDDSSVILEENELYVLSARCYCKAINLIEENVLLYHDLANCYLSHSKKLQEGEERKTLLERALSIIRHCVHNNPTHWQHWNLLGNIAYFQEPKDLALAQHAFIKAVQLEYNSAVAWANLGAVYLHHGDVVLANEAFSQAQRGDPNYVNSWVGQALIAEAAGYEDTMDLFRHSTQLGAHQQGAIGYAYWVCRVLKASPPDAVIYSIHNMHAVPVACDALTWYTENNPTDACAWNMLGMMRERMGLKVDAAKAYSNALSYCDKGDKDHVNVNYGRALMKLGRHGEAVDRYKSVQEATFNSGSGLALALFKDEQYEESYEAYEQALHWLTEEQGFQSDLLVALASMAYLFQGQDAAKTLLFQSTQLEPRSPWGLYATLSLGLLHNDFNLANLVLKELEAVKDTKECLPHYGILLSNAYFLQGDKVKAIRELSKLIHRHPDQGSLWLSLATLLLRLHTAKKVSVETAKCALAAMKLGQSKMDVTKVLCVVSLASLMAGNLNDGLKAAQSAVHTYPNVAEGWCVLISAMKCAKKASDTKIDSVKSFVIDYLHTTEKQHAWLSTKCI